MRAKKLEQAMRLQERAAIRKKNIREYFLNFARRDHLPWLHGMARKYKEHGEFPLMGMTLLPSYYRCTEDKEVAVFAALLMNDGVRTFERVSEFRELLGESPWEWFKDRKFFELSLGRNQNGRTGGVENWKIARMFDMLWQECHVATDKSPLGVDVVFIRPIGVQVEGISKCQGCSYFAVLTYLLEDCGVGNYYYKLRLLLQVLSSSDGFGLGLWEVDDEELKCPLTGGVRQFVQTWFPDYRRYGSIDDAIHLFGFERDCDFFYAYLGYKELQKRNPMGCREYATRYQSWYECGFKAKPYRWRAVMPETEL